MTLSITRSWSTASGALVGQLTHDVDAPLVFQHLSTLPHVLFLDSARRDAPDSHTGTGRTLQLGRYSFVAADPIHSITLPRNTDNQSASVLHCFQTIRKLLKELSCPSIPGLPPFQGGIAGLWSYECGFAGLNLSPPTCCETVTPLLSLHLYDVVFAFDHVTNDGWIISQGIPAQGLEPRRKQAFQRLEAMLALEASASRTPAPDAAPDTKNLLPKASATTPWLHPLPTYPEVRSNFSRDAYIEMVEQGIEYVRAGDMFQVNLAQQMSLESSVDPVMLYSAARTCNPAPFAGFFDAGDTAIASMSPERFLRVTGQSVNMHPIKGTRRVTSSPEADLFAAADLATSDKDRAENVMIVDLVRNDLAKVCRPESIQVESLCRLERFQYVQHLVSIVTGHLRRGLHALDAFEAAIPGGSITGAPKHRACEIISELEGMVRGAYCGSLGYLGFDGSADFNLLIRTFVIESERISFAAGGGITVRSDPAAEYEETLHKAEGMLRAIDAVTTTANSSPENETIS